VKVCAPIGAIGVNKEEHQMRMPMAGAIAQVALFRHHVCQGIVSRHRDAIAASSDLVRVTLSALVTPAKAPT
jgi:hypothetical protein